MAMARFTMKARTRETNGAGHGGKRAVSYLVREGEYAPHQDVGYLTRERERGAGREDLVWREVGNLPAWADGDPYRFFGAAYDGERANGRWAIALEASLPRELTRAQQRELAQDFARTHLIDHAYLMVQHEPIASDGRGQPHIHVLFSERRHDGIARGEDTYFRRANRRQPERGGTAKEPFWHARACPARMRQAWADLTNYHLERAGQAVRVDTRSLAIRGIARESQYTADAREHTYPSQSPEAQRARVQTAPAEQRVAYEHWEARKQVLGMRHVYDVSRDDIVERIRTWTRTFQPGKQRTVDDLRTREHDLSRM